MVCEHEPRPDPRMELEDRRCVARTFPPFQIRSRILRTPVTLAFSQRITPYALNSCYRFLDESHLLVLFDQDIRIYDFSPSPSPSLGAQDQDQDPPAAPLTIDDCPCILRLPPVAHEAVHSMDPKLFVPHSPSASPNSTPPPFHHNPALKVVCLAFSLISIARDEPLSHRVERYMFLFPASALLAEFQRVRGLSSASPTGTPHDVPWEDWGPRSCRVFRTATSSLDSDCVGVSGTKVVLSRRLGWDEDGRRARMQLQVVDVNPGASVDPPSIPAAAAGGHVAGLLPLADPGEDGCIADCRLFRGGCVRSELPYTIATHEVELELEDGVDARRDDGRFRMFVFEDQWMFVGRRFFAFFVWLWHECWG